MDIKKKVVLILGCLLFCSLFSGNLSCSEKIGIVKKGEKAGEDLVKKFTSMGYQAETIELEDVLDKEKLSAFSGLWFNVNWRQVLPDQVNSIREFIKKGGRVYFGYTVPMYSDFTGVIDANSGYGVEPILKFKAVKEAAISKGFPLNTWIDIELPEHLLIPNYLQCHGLTVVNPDTTEVIFVSENYNLEKTKKDNKDIYEKVGRGKTYNWITLSRYGKGEVVTGADSFWRMLWWAEGHKCSLPMGNKLLTNILDWLSKKPNGLSGIISSNKIIAGELHLKVFGSQDKGKYIIINREKIGEVPLNPKPKEEKGGWWDVWSEEQVVKIPEDKLPYLGTENEILFTNEPSDCYKVKDIYLKVTLSDGKEITSNIDNNIYCSHTGWGFTEGKCSKYVGWPLGPSIIKLPEEATGGYLKVQKGSYEEPEIVAKKPLDIKKIEKISLPNSENRTVCCLQNSNFLFQLSEEEILRKLKSFNSNTLGFFVTGGFMENPGTDRATVKQEVKDKISSLRSKGIKIWLLIGHQGGMEGVKYFKTDSSGKVSTSPSYIDPSFQRYILRLIEIWSPLVDYIGEDEWNFGYSYSFDEKMVEEFKKKYKYTDTDVDSLKTKCWGKSSEKIVLDWWEFKESVLDDLFIKMAKKAREVNPKVKPSITFITHPRNRIKSVHKSLAYYDVLFDCQLYWYGRWSDTALNAPLVTKAGGWSKLVRAEYPDKEFWVGFSPGYAEGKVPEASQWWNHVSYYNNTPEEVFPYLASLYAAADKVFIFTVFNGYAPGLGSDDDFAEMCTFLSKTVPVIKDYKKSDIAFYHDQEKQFKIWLRNGRGWSSQEGDCVPLGYLEQFLDADVTDNLQGYKNIIVTNDYNISKEVKNKSIFFWGNAIYDGNGENIGSPVGKFTSLPPGIYETEGKKVFLYSSNKIEGDDINPINSVSLISQGTKSGEFIISAGNKENKIIVDGTSPYYLRQDARFLIKKDLSTLGWVKRDCPQINGKKEAIGYSLIEPRIAVFELEGTQRDKIEIMKFNGSAGLVEQKTIPYKEKIEIELEPYSVVVGRISGKK